MNGLWLTEEVLKDKKQTQNIQSEIEIYSLLASVIGVNCVIFAIIIIKYSSDIYATFVKGEGGVPYEG